MVKIYWFNYFFFLNFFLLYLYLHINLDKNYYLLFLIITVYYNKIK